MEEPEKERIALLIGALADEKVSVRWNAARELGRFGAKAHSAVPVLTALLSDRDGTTVLWARCALVRIEGNAAAHLPTLIATLNNPKGVFPGMAAAALAEFGPLAAPAVPDLLSQLTAPHPDNRWSAAGALAAIGPAAHPAVPTLAHVLREDSDEKVRWYVAWALSEMGPASALAIPALLDALGDVDDDVRGYAAKTLGRIGREACGTQLEEVISRFHAAMADEEPAVRAEMEHALRCLED